MNNKFSLISFSLFINLFLFVSSHKLNAQSELNNAFEKYWSAKNGKQRQKSAKKIIKLKPDFQEVYEALKKGKNYNHKHSSSFTIWKTKTSDGIFLQSIIIIPKDYNHQKTYAVKITLHGSVHSKDSLAIFKYVKENKKRWDTTQFIWVYPAGYVKAKWWDKNQTEHLKLIIDKLKREFNIDENRIHLRGISDGGTGSYFQANCNQTSFASYSSYIGSLDDLRWNVFKEISVYNFLDKPFCIVNTGKDHIFPANITLPYIEMLKKANVKLQFHYIDSSGHNTHWYPIIKDTLENFYNLNSG